MSTEEIVDMMAAQRGLDPDDVRGPRRHSEFVRCRRAVARMLRASGMGYAEIGRALGGRHHTTVMFMLGAIQR